MGREGGVLGGGVVCEEERDQFCAFFIPEAKFSTERERETFMSSFIFYCTYIAY